MKEKAGMGRREFLSKTAMAAIAAPMVLEAGIKAGHAQGGDAKPGPEKTGVRTKKIAIEEHWANQELNDLRTEWGKRTGYPITVDPKAIGYSFSRALRF